MFMELAPKMKHLHKVNKSMDRIIHVLQVGQINLFMMSQQRLFGQKCNRFIIVWMNYQQQSQEEGFYPQELQIEQRTPYSRNKDQQRPKGFKPYQVANLPQMSTFPTQTLQSFTSIPILQTPEEYLNLIRKHSQYRDNGQFQNLFEKYVKHPESYRLLYSRYGPENINKHSQTFTQRNFPLPSLLSYEESEYRSLKKLSFQEMKRRAQSSFLEFDSKFQSGNLSCAFQSLASDYFYHCLVEKDTNTNGYNQWFYFSLQGVKKHTLYRFVFPNLRKRYSFFRTGMKPVLFSFKKLKQTGNGWFSRGYNIRYEKSDLCYIKQNQKRNFYSLYFEIDFDQDQDFVTISHGMPYTYSRLICQLNKCRELALENQVFWEMKTVDYSLSNNQVPQIIVTSQPEEEERKSSIKKYRLQGEWKGSLFSKKKVIVILARQHSSEINSSFLVEELLYALAKRGNYKVAWLLDNFEFRIYPMVNVDGVIYGNTRSDLSGCDLNRVWKHPLKELQPQIYSIKKQILNLHKYNRIAYFLDLHSHSRNYNIFSYGFKYDEITSRLFSHLMSKLCLYFDLSNSSLGVHSQNQKTARGVLAQKIGLMKVTTLETSYYGAKEEGEVKMFQPRIFAEIAKGVLNTLKSYLRNDRLKKESLKFIQDNISSSNSQTVSDANYISDSEPEDDDCFCERRLQMLIPSELARKRITKRINYPSESEEEENKQPADRFPRRPRWEESPEKPIQSQRVALSKEEKTHKLISVKGKVRLSAESITQQQPNVLFKKYEQSNLSVWKKQLAWLKKTKTESGEHNPSVIVEGEGKGVHLVTQSQKMKMFDDNLFQKQMKRLYKNLRSDKRDLNLKNYKIKRDNQFIIRNSKDSPRHDAQCARNEGSLRIKTKVQGIKSLLLSEVKDEGSAIFRIRSSEYSQRYDQSEKMNCSSILERNFQEEFNRLKLQYSQRCNAKLAIVSKLLKKQQRGSFRK